MPKESRQYRRRSRSQSSGSSDDERSRNTKDTKDKRDRTDRNKERSKRSKSIERPRKSRSRSKERRKRPRSRSRSREKVRDRRRTRSRSHEKKKRRRSRSPRRNRRSKSRSKSPAKSKEKFSKKRDGNKDDEKSHIKQERDSKVKEEKEKEDRLKALELEQKKLEVEMQKRRERIERWRQERKKAAEETTVSQETQDEQKKKWSLEDDDEDDEVEEDGKEKEEDEEEDEEEDKDVKDESEDKGAEADDEKEEDDGVDPLDAFMKGVTNEVQKIKANDRERLGLQGGIVKALAALPQTEPIEKPQGKVNIVIGVAKKPPAKVSKQSKQKGELMENDQDAMEWSSEEEQQGNLMDAVAALEQKKKKDLTVVDHSTVTYKSFKKDFYVEVPELARMTVEEVDKRRSDMEGIKVRGKDCPKPIESWVQCGVSQKVLTVLKKNKYAKPTPIQSQAMPAIMAGRDMIGIAKTGSGKTLAFLIPMFRHIMDQDPLEPEDGPISVIMAPTRELAMQIYKECRKFSKSLGLQVVCVYGGTGISEQIAELKKGAEVIVCTPGRMIDMLAANNGRVTNLLRCTYLVLDEADRMFDMGFEPQVMKIVDNVRPDRQTVLFSATFPRQMEALARKILTKPVEVQVGGRSVVCSDVTQHALVIEEEKKFLKLLELLGNYQEKGSVLIFVERQESADLLLRDLLKASYPCLALHGGIDQYDRDSIIEDFKAANVNIMVATSVAARGLDVKQLILVVNYDCPNHYEDYVHRVGRTGRAGNKGFSYTLIQPDQQRYAGDVIKAFELSEQTPPDDIVQMWAEFTEQQKADGKKVFTNSGFSGKGFRFDETEKELANAKKKLQRAALGLQDSDSDDAGMNIDEQIENMFASKKRVKDITEDELPVKSQNVAAQVCEAAPGAIVNKANLELAKRLASRINQSLESGRQTNVVQQATQALMKGGSIGQNPISKMTIAEQIATKLNAKLNYIPKTAQEEEEEKEVPKKTTFRKYEEELEINDFPQTARWKVTSKENLANIQEYSDAGVTIRGTYFPQGKEPKEDDGERKLYLSIESTSELSVQKAKAEITRLIKEELIRLQNSYQPINKGRYKVL